MLFMYFVRSHDLWLLFLFRLFLVLFLLILPLHSSLFFEMIPGEAFLFTFRQCKPTVFDYWKIEEDPIWVPGYAGRGESDMGVKFGMRLGGGERAARRGRVWGWAGPGVRLGGGIASHWKVITYDQKSYNKITSRNQHICTNKTSTD